MDMRESIGTRKEKEQRSGNFFFLVASALFAGALITAPIAPSLFSISSEIIRIGIATVFIAGAVTLYSFTLLQTGRMSLRLPAFLALLFFLAIQIVAAALSIDMRTSFLGYAMELGTVASWAFLTCAFLLGFIVFFRGRSAFRFLFIFGLVFGILSGVSLLGYIFQGNFSTYIDISPVSAGLLLLLSLAAFELFPSRGLFRIGISFILLVAATTVFVARDVSVLTALIIGISIILFSKLAYEYRNIDKKTGGDSHFRVPYVSIVLFVTTILMLSVSIGAGGSTGLPQWTETKSIFAQAVRTEPQRILFGSGPHTFSYPWQKYRGVESNSGPFWAADISSSGSGFGTILITSGIFGIFSILLFFLTTIYTVLKKVRNALVRGVSPSIFFLLITSFSMTFFVFYLFLFSIVGFGEMVIAFGLLGMFYGTGQQHINNTNLQKKRSFVSLFLSLIFAATGVVLTAGSLFYMYTIFSFESSVSDTNGVLSEQISPRTYVLIQPEQERFLAELIRLQLQHVVETYNDSDLSAQEDYLASQMIAMREHALSAATREPWRYTNWITLGNVYTQLALFGVSSGVMEGIFAYEQASALAPTHPLPHLQKAKLLFYLSRDNVSARQSALTALHLKPDYVEARAFLEEIEKIPDGQSVPVVESLSD